MILVMKNEMPMGGMASKMIEPMMMPMKSMSMSTESCVVPVNVCEMESGGGGMDSYMMSSTGTGGMYGMNPMAQMMGKMYGMGVGMGMD